MVKVPRHIHIPPEIRLPIDRPDPSVKRCIILIGVGGTLSTEKILGSLEKGHVEEEQV
jgi:hypothetical protein